MSNHVLQVILRPAPSACLEPPEHRRWTMKKIKKNVWLLILTFVFSGCTTSGVIIHHEQTAERLRKIPVVEMDFKGAATSDVVEYLALNLHCIGHPPIYPKQIIKENSVTYVIPFDTYDAHNPNSSALELKGTNKTEVTRLGPAVTLRIRNSTMLDVMKEVTKKFQGSAEVSKDQITIRTKKVQPPVAPVQNVPAAGPF
ncbi:MAG: hypothetical protein A2283_24015 [Lentisphaerae bacterium RIFOXYA12_FULL_48_11]|nr:MAG: hypothetical protein A2283_24015 [Lentisphaerae bacterium RIFOXYA12_FULL_48_11]